MFFVRRQFVHGLAIFLCLSFSASAQDQAEWKQLLNKNLNGWEVVGDGIWSVLKDGILVGQSDPRDPFKHQSWLYTRKTFDQFDLHAEYWMRLGSNSGVSIGDKGRAHFAVGPDYRADRTPAHLAYEINLDNGVTPDPDIYDVSGSIYLVVKARKGPQHNTDWNSLDIEVRKNLIQVRVNGVVVAEHAPLPNRPTSGPFGLQLHDNTDVIMFRDLRIREIR